MMACHHDNFDLYPTTVHDWNSTKVGPKRDLVGEFATAAKAHNLRWVATLHSGHNFYPAAGAADKEGPKAGVPYDLALTKADGKGKWWEGLDPQDLYKFPHKNVDVRARELMMNYKPDMVYFDNQTLRHKWVLLDYYRDSLARNGRIETIVTVKKPAPGAMLDMERGQLDTLQDFKILYAFIYGAKPGAKLTLEPLRTGGLLASKIESVSLLGSDKPLAFESAEQGLKVTLPETMPSPIACVLKISTAGL
jgi:hypothetical protein